MILTDQEVERYARQVVMPEIGEVGQKKLLDAKVLILGAGGLGAPVIAGLAGAGVGHLTVIDDDEVELTNLNRQIIHSMDRLAMNKAESAALFSRSLNPDIQVHTNTVRFSEKILERHGISVTTIDLSEVLGKAKELNDDSKKVKDSMNRISGYGDTTATPSEKLLQLARLDVVLNDFVETNKLDATAIQCWTSVQENYGCNVCTSMSMMSENMLPSACEVDVTGTLTMYAMQLASNSPSALVDWNNNYDQDEEKCVLFHCGNWAKSFLPDLKISTAPILGSVFGEEKTHGALEGRTPSNPLTYGRISTDDNLGKIKCYFGEGELTDDPLNTFGTRAVAKVPKLQKLMQYVCRHGYEHHVVMNASKTGEILNEACGNYLNWETYIHS